MILRIIEESKFDLENMKRFLIIVAEGLKSDEENFKKVLESFKTKFGPVDFLDKNYQIQ
jgi:hypothetical protein